MQKKLSIESDTLDNAVSVYKCCCKKTISMVGVKSVYGDNILGARIYRCIFLQKDCGY